MPTFPPALSFLSRCRCIAVALVLMLCAAGFARAALVEKKSFSLPADAADVSIKRFSEQAGLEVFYPSHVSKGVRTRAVHGEMTPRQALDAMLADTELVVVQDEKTGAFSLRRAPDPNGNGAAPTTPNDRPATARRPVVPGGVGTLIGTISSSGTGKMLQGVVVSVPSQNKEAVTDNTGRFVLDQLNAGPVELIVRYTGFDEARPTVEVAPGGSTRLALELTSSGVLALDAFEVKSEREGNALAVMQQRNAGNAKNVVAMDALGNLPNLNAGELAIRLPGVAGLLDAEGNVTGVSIRGMAAPLSRVSIDGLPFASVPFGGDRTAAVQTFSGALYEELELIKGQTPDKSADSIGGMVNLKTRSPLSMKDRRRVSYNVGARWTPPFLARLPIQAEHPIHPMINFAYQEVFDVHGGSRNLGISLNYSYVENAARTDYMLYDYQNGTALPNYIWDFRAVVGYYNQHITGGSVKMEYRLSDRSKFLLNVLYNDTASSAIDLSTLRIVTNQTIATIGPNGQPTGTGAVFPGYTNTVTRVRGTAASFAGFTNYSLSYYSKNPTVTFSGDHNFGRLSFDYNARYSHTHYDQGTGKDAQGGQIAFRVPNFGWILDRSDPKRPVVTQTEGANYYDIASYTRDIQFIKRDFTSDNGILNVDANFKYRLATSHPLALKAGASHREQTRETKNRNPRQWDRVANAPPLPSAFMLASTFELNGGRRLPSVDPRAINAEVDNRGLWTENLYYPTSQRYIGTTRVTERIPAAYALVQGKVRRFGFLAGLRFERTEVNGFAYVRGPLATAAQIPDPVARAHHDYNHPVTNRGQYQRSFPSVHATYEIARNFIARGSWSTSFGRPNFAQLAPTATINDTAQTVTGSNPGLGPQYAKNVDLSLEYYFEPTGLISAGYFQKNIKDYILTSVVGTIEPGLDNGFHGNYGGYTLSTALNAGTAKVTGWEFDYRQQLTFLPGFLKGLQLAGNYTVLRAEGDFGGAAVLRNREVAGFIPETANVNLAYNYRKFGVRAGLAYTGGYLSTYNAAPSARIYRDPLTMINAGVSYRFWPRLSLYCDVTNLGEEWVSFYRYVPAQFREARQMPSAVTFGVNGQF